jgi:hypothetical protein
MLGGRFFVDALLTPRREPLPPVASPPAAKAPPARAGGSSWIAGPVYDVLLFLLPPLLALAAGGLLAGTSFQEDPFVLWNQRVSGTLLVLGILVHAHLFAVVFRSHANPAIFRRHPLRFALVPVLLFAGIVSSTWVLVLASVLATFWDVYHSGAQTFGFARIYDRKRGNDAEAGRRLDFWLNQLLYAGPILAGVTMLDHFDDFGRFERVGSAFLTSVPAHMEGHQRTLTFAVLGLGAAFLCFYVISYARLARRGYRVSWQKVYLLASTGVVSVYAWGFNPWGQAFVIMNLFHAVQYLGIVWWAEKGTLKRLFRVQGHPLGGAVALGLFLALVTAYGVFAQSVDGGVEWVWAITLVVSLMHFWYDGFVWSVRREQV